MDPHTQEVKAYLEERFNRCDEDGIYVAEQPIYGFRQGHCEPGTIERYIRTYEILKRLSRLDFLTFLDVGGAEGYRAYLVKEMFGAEVRNCDLSEAACQRCRDIFGIPSDPADIHELPYEDGSFDVVLCSETLEHVSDFRKATNDLLRVARRAVIITVPHEPASIVKRYIEEKIPHGHVHRFDIRTFDFLKQQGCRVLASRLVCTLLRAPAALIEVHPRQDNANLRFPRPLAAAYNALVPLLRLPPLQAVFGKRAAALLTSLDPLACRALSFLNYDALCFLILKDPSCYRVNAARRVSASRLLDFSVPFHCLSKGDGRRGDSS
jgi:hypothetical protein